MIENIKFFLLRKPYPLYDAIYEATHLGLKPKKWDFIRYFLLTGKRLGKKVKQ